MSERKRFLVLEGESVTPGGPYHCGAPRPDQPGRRCGAKIGTPAIGARLVAIATAEAAGEEVCEHGLWVLVCHRCGRRYVFQAREAKTLASAA